MPASSCTDRKQPRHPNLEALGETNSVPWIIPDGLPVIPIHRDVQKFDVITHFGRVDHARRHERDSMRHDEPDPGHRFHLGLEVFGENTLYLGQQKLLEQIKGWPTFSASGTGELSPPRAP